MAEGGNKERKFCGSHLVISNCFIDTEWQKSAADSVTSCNRLPIRAKVAAKIFFFFTISLYVQGFLSEIY